MEIRNNEVINTEIVAYSISDKCIEKNIIYFVDARNGIIHSVKIDSSSYYFFKNTKNENIIAFRYED